MHITDPHLFADAEMQLRGMVTQLSLQTVLDHIRASDSPADMVVMTGDLIQDDSPAAYERFCSQLSLLDLPVYCVPGNHDMRDLMRTTLQKNAFHYCENARIGDWQLVAVDSCQSGSAAGEISKDELLRLDTVLDTSDAEHVLIYLHHPPLPVNSKWLDTVGIDNAQIFLDLITRYPNVRGAIFGHIHQNFDSSYQGIRIIGTPSTCRQFEAGSDEFAVDDNPPAYRRINLLSDGIIEDELIWVASE